jgi:hypothetical protein
MAGYRAPDPAGTVSYRDWVAEIVGRYKNDPTILAWQLVNEAEVQPGPAADCGANAAQILKSFATDVSGLVKSIDPNHLVSLGTIGSGQCGAEGAEYQDLHAVPTIDLCEYHDYGEPNAAMPGDGFNGLAVRIDQCQALHKPIFVGESGIVPSDVGDGTLAARADAFDAKFNAQFCAGVAGELVWHWSTSGSQVDDHDVGAGDPTIGVLARYALVPGDCARKPGEPGGTAAITFISPAAVTSSPTKIATKKACRVPKVRRLSLKKAKKKLGKAGCRYKTRGKGRVVSTKPSAGKRTTKTVLVKAKPKKKGKGKRK